MVNCSAAVRNFYIESSLGTFISEQQQQQSSSSLSSSQGAAGTIRGFGVPSSGVVFSESNVKADQISKSKLKMGRHRIIGNISSGSGSVSSVRRKRRRRRRKRSPLEVLSLSNVRDSGHVASGREWQQSRLGGSRLEEAEEVAEADSPAKAHHRDNTNESLSSERSGADSVDAGEASGMVERTRNKRDSGSGAANCRNKNVWIENFVYSPTFTVKWRFSQRELEQQSMNQTNKLVISFR